jgi:hypothetical protein
MNKKEITKKISRMNSKQKSKLIKEFQHRNPSMRTSNITDDLLCIMILNEMTTHEHSIDFNDTEFSGTGGEFSGGGAGGSWDDDKPSTPDDCRSDCDCDCSHDCSSDCSSDCSGGD